ncbi:uncharacterized protein LOC119433669 [Dermacentor silvarum]|uniref:uncharacterized protein LOC119433669 n=1 Tax=Dermacentor silvarum TaxID=543639 RepID=UPI00189A44F2|nr:uncharacterized protein LOC119433669 [Dermacentor silvarum]
MVGFRRSLSCQDVMLRLKHDILTPNPTHDTQAIVGLDLHGAFNNVDHCVILRQLNLLGVGERIHNYIAAFLSNRIATIFIGAEQSPTYHLGSFGTPQGSVLSPLLFNFAMLHLSRSLKTIPRLNFSLYADYITLWVTGGSDGEIQDVLQAAADKVEAIAGRMGLVCSPEKSEILLLPAHTGNPRHTPDIHILLGNKHVPRVDKLRVLGLHIQSNRHNTHTLQTLQSTVDNTPRLLGRVSNRHGGLLENDLLRLIQAGLCHHKGNLHNPTLTPSQKGN